MYPGNPNVPLKDWRSFSSQLSPYFREAISREDMDLPYWLKPMARGVILASSTLLRRTGSYVRGLPRGWKRIRPDVYQLSIGKVRLRVQPTNDRRAWLILRWNRAVHSEKDSETIVHRFGSTPLVVPSRNEAMRLASWFQANESRLQLRWERVANYWIVNELAMAMRRARREGLQISWDQLWTSNAHTRRLKTLKGRRRSRRLSPPLDVRDALRAASKLDSLS
jgi:hypothetical protein